jgi:hypothetical protein
VTWFLPGEKKKEKENRNYTLHMAVLNVDTTRKKDSCVLNYASQL